MMRIRALSILAALALLILEPVGAAEKEGAGQGALPASPAQSLIGGWTGGPCEGAWVYRADGTFRANSYTPGNNRLAGTWELKAGAVPPTLVRTCKTSDDPDLVGKTWEVKISKLDEKTLACDEARGYPPHSFTRLSAAELAKEEAFEEAREKELPALQGTWVPLEYEEGGKKAEGKITTRHIIKGDKITIQVDGQTVETGRVVLDPTQNPRQLYLHLHSGVTHALIYVRIGDHIIYCGNRREDALPKEFASGTPRGGEYLIAWKIQK